MIDIVYCIGDQDHFLAWEWLLTIVLIGTDGLLASYTIDISKNEALIAF